MTTKIQYSSHPIRNYRVGRFQFDNGLLTLDSDEDNYDFLSIIDSKGFPTRERHLIKLLDMAAAESLSKEYQRKSGATKAIDSSVGERATEAPKIGIGDLLTGSGQARPAFPPTPPSSGE